MTISSTGGDSQTLQQSMGALRLPVLQFELLRLVKHSPGSIRVSVLELVHGEVDQPVLHAAYQLGFGLSPEIQR